MYLKDFRPVSFEVNGKPLVMTDSGLAVDNGATIVANHDYETGDRRGIITILSNNFILKGGSESELFDGDLGNSFELEIRLMD